MRIIDIINNGKLICYLGSQIKVCDICPDGWRVMHVRINHLKPLDVVLRR